jgi:hypothetical protein
MDIFAHKAIVSFNSELEKEAVLYFHNKRWTWPYKLERLFNRMLNKPAEVNPYMK